MVCQATAWAAMLRARFWSTFARSVFDDDALEAGVREIEARMQRQQVGTGSQW